MTAPDGSLEGIWIKRAHRSVMDAVASAELVTRKGLAGNVDQTRRRPVTLLEAEVWERVMRELGADAPTSARRANLVLRSISLANTRGRVLRIGAARLVIGGELTPCERMDEAVPGLQRLLRPNWGGGAFAQVLEGALIAVGDPVSWE
jgi:MOSC domain-containing protein YiiM